MMFDGRKMRITRSGNGVRRCLPAGRWLFAALILSGLSVKGAAEDVVLPIRRGIGPVGLRATFLPDGDVLAWGMVGHDATPAEALVFDPEQPLRPTPLLSHRFDAGAKLVGMASASKNPTIVGLCGRSLQVWSRPTGKARRIVVSEKESLLPLLLVSPDSRTAMTAAGNGDFDRRTVLELWDTRKCTHRASVELDLPFSKRIFPAAAFTPDGERFVAVRARESASGRGYTDRLGRWDVSGQGQGELAPSEFAVDRLTFSEDGKRLFLLSEEAAEVRDAALDRRIAYRSWGRTGGEFYQPIAVFPDETESSPLGFVVLGNVPGRGQTSIWDVASAQLRTLPEAHADSVRSVAVSPDGLRIASGGEDWRVRISTTDGKSLGTLEGHERTVGSVAFSPDGRWLVSVGDDWTVRLWDRHDDAP